MLVKCVKDYDAVTQNEALSDHKFVAHLCAFLRLNVVTTPSQNKAISLELRRIFHIAFKTQYKQQQTNPLFGIPLPK